MKEINVALIGTKFMGRAHGYAYRAIPAMFPDHPRPRMKVICGRDKAGAEEMARRFGWEEASINWEEVVKRKDIDMVDISAPGNLHAPIAIAAAQSGKHILCEKPLANTLTEAQAMVEAVRKARVVNAVQFNYRRVPSIALAKRMIDEGRIGKVLHFRARYLQDWAMSTELPAVWRFDKAAAGSGTLGDLGAHITDLCLFLAGDITEVAGLTETFIKERPALDGKGKKKVTVDDAALFIGRLSNGAVASFEVTRFAPGRKNYNACEINGTKGSLAFNLEQLNELQFFSTEDPDHARGFRDIMVTNAGAHPYMKHWWPEGHIVGWEESHTNMIADFLQGVAKGESPRPNFDDGMKVQSVLDAVERSATSRKFESVSAHHATA